MTELLVVNTGPLITLERMGALDLPARLPFSFICPDEVRAELDDGHRAGHLPITPDWLRTQSLTTPVSPLGVSALDRGEAAVIQLALELKIGWVCIDEWKGRRAALAAGLKVTGVLGLLGMAKKKGIIGTISPFIDKAVAAGIRYDSDLLDRVLRAAGEL